MYLTIKKLGISFLFFFGTSLLFSQNLEDDFRIKTFHIDKTINTPSSMPYLDSMVSDYNHFFMDEYHGKSIDDNLKKKFVHYLSDKRQLEKLVMEEPYAYGYWVNKYLESGDTVLLRNFLTNYYLTDYGKSNASRVGEYYDFFTWIYDLNQSSSVNIMVEGIDVNFVNLKSDFWTLKKLFEDFELAEYFPDDYEGICKLEGKKKVGYRNAKKWLKRFNKNRIAKKEILKNKLKDDLIHFDNIVSNLSDALNMFTLRSYFNHPTGYRDSLMYLRYIQQVKPNEVAFSQFGGWHMLLSMGEKVQKLPGYKAEFVSYTSLVNKNSKYSGKCLAINLVYGEKDYSYGSYFFSMEEYNELRRSTNYQEVLLDFSSAKEPYSTIAEYYQIAIFLNGRIYN